jgi:molecular chaperone DnaK (HSP70)
VAVFGLDFGTTNSLAAYVEDGKAVSILERERPHPSVVWYHGSERKVGRSAKKLLSDLAVGVTGDIVRSPKRYLGSGEMIYVGGRARAPHEVVGDVLSHVRQHALQQRLKRQTFDRAVFTIPVNLVGRGRRELRQAALQAGIHVDQFVHEPLAALYGFLRGRPHFEQHLAELRDQTVLVFDWGGGTLDLTLCRFDRQQLLQVQNVGNDSVGGDRFDDRLVNLVRRRHAESHALTAWPSETDGARARLLEECEIAKIELSSKTAQSVFVRNMLRLDGAAADLNVQLTRADLEAEAKDLVDAGMETIDRLLTSANQAAAGVAFCLATGGMVQMPLIRERLQQRFSLAGVRFPEYGDRIIAEGAAWIAHDQHRLCLAKRFEVLDADNSYVPLLHAGQTLPREGESQQKAFNFYTVDPRDGSAKLQFARPKQPGREQAGDPRQVYTTVTLDVDPRAKPLVERLAVDLTIDQDLIVHIDAQSTVRQHATRAEIHELEFGLRFSDLPEQAGATTPRRDTGSKAVRSASGGNRAVTLRSNVTRDSTRTDLIPGEMIRWDPRAVIPERQQREHEYYIPCLHCKRLLYQIQRDGCVEPGCNENSQNV